MRVLMYPGFLESTWSSIEERYLWLDAPLREQGACFWLVPATTLPEPRYVSELRKIGANLIHCDLRPTRLLRNFSQLASIFSEFRIDVVYTHFGPLRFQVEAAAKLRGVRVARGEHNFAFHADRRFKPAKRLFWRWSTDFFVPVSNAVAAHLAEAGVMHGNGMVVHDGFDLASYPRPTPDASRRDVLDEFGLPDGYRLLVCVAKIHPAKQQHLLVEMMSELRDQPVALLLAGAVADNGYHAELCNRSRELGLEHRILFTGYRSDIPRLMDAADVSYLPSRVEGLGNVLVESYLMETPAIASDLPAIREIIIHEKVGYLVQGQNVDEYARRTRALLSDESLRIAMGAGGRALVAGKFGRPAFEQNSVQALRRCLGGEAGGPSR